MCVEREGGRRGGEGGGGGGGGEGEGGGGGAPFHARIVVSHVVSSRSRRVLSKVANPDLGGPRLLGMRSRRVLVGLRFKVS